MARRAGPSAAPNATVSITVGPVVWFINNAVGGPGDGRFTSPFNSIANFNTLATDDPGDYIFIYQGSGAYSGALTLLSTQQLIGHGVGLSISPNLAIAAGTHPTISNVTLASGNTVRGFTVVGHQETPGLGAEIERPEWQQRWQGKALRDDEGRVRIRVVRDAASADAADAAFDVQGISGATRTGDGIGELVRFWVGPRGFGPYLARLREGGEG